uniref:tetratricopeptide repeat protein n=1 Tax=Ningiella ruwaisensis TaxID=2364274 RepID=UPI00109F688B|nr:tetratricopeptide repeat protein [Ningiella ruwaisensis]
MQSSFTSVCLSILIYALFSYSVFAQERLSSGNPTNPNQQDNDVEEIEVTGQAGDAALQAFAAGNFELAEIKFSENAECALRVERNKRAFIQDMQNAQINQSLSGAASSNNPSGSAPSTPINSTSSMASSFDGRGSAPVRDKTCENRGYQLYMVGMSQLQLGRSEEAEENFERAVNINKRLHDAVFRLALMKLLRDDSEGASDHLQELHRLLKKCHNCESFDKIQANIDFLERAIQGSIPKQ